MVIWEGAIQNNKLMGSKLSISRQLRGFSLALEAARL